MNMSLLSKPKCQEKIKHEMKAYFDLNVYQIMYYYGTLIKPL